MTSTVSPPQATATIGDAVTSNSSVAPNVFLTYGGRQYRLVDIQQANLLNAASFAKAGTATKADIDQADLTVFKRNGDADAIYTYAPERGAVSTAPAGEEATTPALWYRWTPE